MNWDNSGGYFDASHKIEVELCNLHFDEDYGEGGETTRKRNGEGGGGKN